MLNSGDNVHGGCSMFLIDVCVPSVNLSSATVSLARPRHRPASHRSCSFIALYALGIATDRKTRLVSQALTAVFHAPAKTCVNPASRPTTPLTFLQRREAAHCEYHRSFRRAHGHCAYRGASCILPQPSSRAHGPGTDLGYYQWEARRVGREQSDAAVRGQAVIP